MKPIFYFLGMLLFSLSSCDSSALRLDQNASIILPIEADTFLEKAATELQFFIKAATGMELSIQQLSDTKVQNAIFLGFPNNPLYQNLSPETVYYYAQDGQLWIGGGTSQSTLFACYEFLEQQMGIRFYSPDYTKIPISEHLELTASLDYSYTPPITTRTVHANLFYNDPVFADRQKVTKEAFPKYVPGARVHTFHRFLPADEYYATHPEYYALRNGKRLTTQLCLTNPEVLQIVKDKVAELFEQNPEHPIISVSQDDNTQYCQCDACAAIDESEESPAGTMIHFVNEVAQDFPDKQISTLAYQYTRKAPKNIKPAPNVLITLCSIECDRSAPIAEKCPDFAADLISWGKLTDNIRIWDYTTQFTNFLAPFPNLHTLSPNIQLFKQNNAKWIFEQHSNAPSELFELRAYLTAKLLWNPDLAPNLIIDDFLSGYYVAAAPFIKNYITRIHDELEKDSSFFLFLYGDPSQGFDSFLNAENLQQYNNWYDEAEAQVKDNKEVLARVRKARLSIDYASLEAARKGLSDSFSLHKNKLATEERLQQFATTTKAEGITSMNEMRYSVQEYLDTYQQTLARSQSNNLATTRNVQLFTKPKKYAQEAPRALTDGAFGGANFYANWLGFEGNDLEAVIDLEQVQNIGSISSAFLQVVNHIVFLPQSVSYYGSLDGQNYTLLGMLNNPKPLRKDSKINDIQNFDLNNLDTKARYIKIKADNMDTAPDWHHGAGLPAWIFIDEVIVSPK